MNMIFYDECELDYVIDVIGENWRAPVDCDSAMEAAHILAERLRAELLGAGGLDEDQVSDASDIVNWLLPHELPLGAWQRAYAQCLAKLLIYFWRPVGAVESPADRLSSEGDLYDLRELCGHVLMADRLRLASDELGLKLETTEASFKESKRQIDELSLRLVSPDPVVMQALSQILESLAENGTNLREVRAGVAALRPKENGNQKALRLLRQLETERAEYLQRGARFLVKAFEARAAVNEGCGADNIHRLLKLGRSIEMQKAQDVSAGSGISAWLNPKPAASGIADTRTAPKAKKTGHSKKV